MKYTLGCFPFLNAKPLINWFEAHSSEVEMVCDVPSKLATMMRESKLDAMLASSIEALRNPNMKIAYGVGISSASKVTSVKIFSKVHPAQIHTLALDKNSLTANALAQIILIEKFGIRPRTCSCQPDLVTMLEELDAATVIGDNCLKICNDDYYELDLGAEWYAMTRLPFVWALWMGKDQMSQELVNYVAEAKEWGTQRLSSFAEEFAETENVSVETCTEYLSNILSYDLGERQLEGLYTFGRYLMRHDFIKEAHSPEVIKPTSLV